MSFGQRLEGERTAQRMVRRKGDHLMGIYAGPATPNCH